MNKNTLRKFAKIQNAGELIFYERDIHQLGEHLVSGHQYLDSLKKAAPYFSMWGYNVSKHCYKYNLVSLLKVKCPSLTYYCTSQTEDKEMFTAVFLIKQRDIGFDDMSHYKQYCLWADDKPVVLYFLGHDDESYIKRFKTEEEALNYIKKFTSLDDVLDENIGNELFEEYRPKGNPIPEKEVSFVFDHFICPQN